MSDKAALALSSIHQIAAGAEPAWFEGYDDTIAAVQALKARADELETDVRFAESGKALDAERIKRLEAKHDRLRSTLSEVMEWIDNWDPNFTHDDEWPATAAKARAALEGAA